MRALTVLLAYIALSGCTVALHGQQAAGSGTPALTRSAVRVQAGGGGARLGGSFGAPAPQGAANVQASFSGGASAVLVIGLVVAETLHYLGTRFGERPAPGTGAQRAIADTCSCYGYRPPETVAAVPGE